METDFLVNAYRVEHGMRLGAIVNGLVVAGALYSMAYAIWAMFLN